MRRSGPAHAPGIRTPSTPCRSTSAAANSEATVEGTPTERSPGRRVARRPRITRARPNVHVVQLEVRWVTQHAPSSGHPCHRGCRRGHGMNREVTSKEGVHGSGRLVVSCHAGDLSPRRGVPGRLRCRGGLRVARCGAARRAQHAAEAERHKRHGAVRVGRDGRISRDGGAHGSLFGVRSIELVAPAASAPRFGPTRACSGSSRCVRLTGRRSSRSPTGSCRRAVGDPATAVDPLGTRSTAVTRTVRIDRSGPLLEVSGELRDARWLADRRTPRRSRRRTGRRPSRAPECVASSCSSTASGAASPSSHAPRAAVRCSARCRSTAPRWPKACTPSGSSRSTTSACGRSGRGASAWTDAHRRSR